MIDILFIAFEFPPVLRGGVYRSIAFVEHLPKYGINPIVITLDPASFKQTFDNYGYDEKLGREVIDRSTIVPVPASPAVIQSGFEQFVTIYFSILGNEVRYWKDNFYEAVDKAVEKYQPKAIFATVPPFSVLELAAEAARKHQLPLVLDFRDAFSQWRGVPYGSILHYRKTVQVEKKYLNAAAAVVATSLQTIDDFKTLHRQVAAEKFHYIPNGYSGHLKAWREIEADKETYTIGYVGGFYYNPGEREQMLKPWWRKRGHRMLQYIPRKQDWMYRSPYFFFTALQELNALDPVLGKRIRVRFAGKKPGWLAEMIRALGLGEQVELIGELSHQESLAFQENCDALLITSAKQFGGRDYSIAGKTFEYLQMQRPVIAFVCEGAQKDLLASAGTALICDPDDRVGSAARLRELFGGKISFGPNYEFLKQLTREALTQQLAGVIKNAIAHT